MSTPTPGLAAFVCARLFGAARTIRVVQNARQLIESGDICIDARVVRQCIIKMRTTQRHGAVPATVFVPDLEARELFGGFTIRR